MKADCPRCADKVSSRRACRFYDRTSGATKGLGMLVVTFPRSWHDRIHGKALGELGGKLSRLVREFFQDAIGVDIGGRQYWHPCGDGCDKCGYGSMKADKQTSMGRFGNCSRCGALAPWKPHWNAIVPSCGIDMKTGEVRHFHPFLLPYQLGELAIRLTTFLGEVAAVLGEPEPGRANFHWSFGKKEGKKRHMLRYAFRPFPAWQDFYPRGSDFGLLAGQDRNGDTRRARLRAQLRGEEESEVAPSCPCCGKELVHLGPLGGVEALAWIETAVDLDMSEPTGPPKAGRKPPI
jgi:hypothetical protein